MEAANLESLKFAKEAVRVRNHWTRAYVNQVYEEWEKFMLLKVSADEKKEEISPSDDIDELWHQLILDTAFYYNYCNSNFNKIIHHKPQDAEDQEARVVRRKKAIDLYQEFYEVKNSVNIVWQTRECSICSVVILSAESAETPCCKRKTCCEACSKKEKGSKTCIICRKKRKRVGDDEKIQVFVRFSADTSVYMVTKGTTILEFKQIIAKERDLDVEAFRLTSGQIPLIDDKTMQECKIEEGSTFYFHVRVKGC